LTSEVPDSQYVVTANPRYWDTAARPHLAKITFEINTTDTSRAAAVLGGQADIALSPPPAQVATYCANPQVRVSEITSSLMEIICLNLDKAPLNNVDVRQAISLALDRQAIIQAGLSGLAVPATTYFVGPPSQTYQDPDLNLYPYDPARARQLMRLSGVHTPITLPRRTRSPPSPPPSWPRSESASRSPSSTRPASTAASSTATT
jgi:dipeptide transport system substrate-binding protein